MCGSATLTTVASSAAIALAPTDAASAIRPRVDARTRSSAGAAGAVMGRLAGGRRRRFGASGRDPRRRRYCARTSAVTGSPRTSRDVRVGCAPRRMARAWKRRSVSPVLTDRDPAPGGTVARGAPWWPALAVGPVLATVMAFASAHIPVTGDERGLDVLGFVLIVGAAFALSFARHYPKPVLVVVTVALAIYILRGYVGGPIYVTGWLALAALSWRTDRRTAVVGGIATWLVLGSASVLASGHAWIGALVYVGWSAAAVLFGDVVRNRGVARAQLE